MGAPAGQAIGGGVASFVESLSESDNCAQISELLDNNREIRHPANFPVRTTAMLLLPE
jgi:hypothetical protein